MSLLRCGLSHRTLLACNSCIRRASVLAHSIPTELPADGNRRASTSTAASPIPKRVVRRRGKKIDLDKLEASNILENSKLQGYLNEVAASSGTVTLQDVERLKPRTHSTPGSVQYATEYNGLVENLLRSFNEKQLGHFVKLYGIKATRTGPKKWAKAEYAAAIIEKQWDWPSLSEIEKHQADWSIQEKAEIPMTTAQSLLIMGKDGADLLSMSQRFNSYIALAVNPMRLKVEGVVGAIQQLKDHIETVKKEISEERMKLPTSSPIRPDLLQRIMRLSGAFVETATDGTVRFSYKRSDPRPLAVAKNLVMRAACGSSESNVPMLFYSQKSPLREMKTPLSLFMSHYSLFPFGSSRTLPWTMNASSVFRVRRVSEWLAPQDDSLSSGLGKDSTKAINQFGDALSVQDQLLQNLATTQLNEGSDRVVTARHGHIVFTSPTEGQTTLLSPLPGNWPLSRFLAWVREQKSEYTFMPSLPSSLLEAPLGSQKILHRLVYQLPQTDDPTSTAKNVVQVEMLLHTPAPAGQGEMESALENSEDNVSISQDDTPLTCKIGTETTLNLLMPDRPIDVQFSAFDSQFLTENELPEQLKLYEEDLRKFLRYPDPNSLQPSAPLLLNIRGYQYVLQTSQNVRQSTDNIPLAETLPPIEAITESIFDLESHQKITLSQIQCKSWSSEEDWSHFLQACDQLGSKKFSTRPSTNNLISQS